MSKILLGIICGFVSGGISVATMVPLPLEDKKRAMVGAFANRFSIGFGLLLSLADAIITKAWLPILTLGAIGGVVTGIVIEVWGK